MALAIVLGVVPMTWWMKCILLFVFFGLVVDLLARSEWTYGFSRKHKLFLCVVAALAVSAIGWKPVRQQYYEDQLVSTSQAISQIKDHLDKEANTQAVLAALDKQLQRLMFGTVVWENSIGRPDLPQRLAVEGHILSEMRVLSGNPNIRAISHDSGDLWLITGQNSFRVTFPTPMRVPPQLKFVGLPEGVTPNVVEKSTVGFWVIFGPQTTRVDAFGYTVNAEL